MSPVVLTNFLSIHKVEKALSECSERKCTIRIPRQPRGSLLCSLEGLTASVGSVSPLFLTLYLQYNFPFTPIASEHCHYLWGRNLMCEIDTDCETRPYSHKFKVLHFEVRNRWDDWPQSPILFSQIKIMTVSQKTNVLPVSFPEQDTLPYILELQLNSLHIDSRITLQSTKWVGSD